MVGVKMKDIFSNKRLFMSPTASDIYAEHDQRVFIDMFGYDKLHSKMLIGQFEMSLISIIQSSMSDEAEALAETRLVKARKDRAEAEAQKARV